MAAKETPLQTVVRLHGSKETFVEKLAKDLNKAGEDVEDLQERLMATTNKKLLRLAEVAATVNDEFGGKDGLVKAVAEAHGKARDADYIDKLGTYPLPRLLDMRRSGRRAA